MTAAVAAGMVSAIPKPVTSASPVAANVVSTSTSDSVRRLTRRSAAASTTIEPACTRSIAAPAPSEAPLGAAAVTTA